jgi:predicted nucleic acid-binding protein
VVLVDTSVWVRFLAGRAPHASGLDRLLANDQVLSHDLVQGELLIGDSCGRARTRLLAAYSEIHRARTVAHAEVVEFVESRQLRGRGIGWVDAHLLASTMVERCTLWTADASLADLAAELRVAHTATR